MKELVEVIAKSLVEHPDEVVVTENEKEDAVIIELKVGPSDMGKVIGRQGFIKSWRDHHDTRCTWRSQSLPYHR